jgi:hypothetical protein
MSLPNTLELIENEILDIQEKISKLDKKGCELCGYLDSEAVKANELEQEYHVKLREYEMAKAFIEDI